VILLDFLGHLVSRMQIGNPLVLEGDYPAAIARATAALRWFWASRHFLFLRGTAYLFAGQFPEAEADLRQSLALRSGISRTSALVNLGYIRMDRRQFEEALAVFEQAAMIYDASGTAYGGMAEARVRGQMEPGLAIDLLERGIRLRTGNSRMANVDRHTLAYMWANYAWALALRGRMTEAHDAAARTLVVADDGFAPGFAGTKWRLGTAYLAMGDGKEALEQYSGGAQSDPGSSGRF
jgi:tetratricopeptide (TPR) repeat protein